MIHAFTTFFLTIRAVDAFSGVMKDLRADFVKTAAAMGTLAVPVAVGAGLLYATKQAANYEQQMRKVQALALDPAQQKQRQDLLDTGTAMGRLSQGVLDLAHNVPYGPTKLAQALYMVESAGFRGQDAIHILGISAKDAATGGLADATSMARSLTSVLTSYHGAAKDAGMYSDIFMTAVTRGKTQVGELDAALSTILPIAAGAGVSFQQVAAAMATITQHGTTASSAATSLRRAITAITAPTQSQRKTAEALGVGSLLSGKAVAQLGLPTVINRLAEAAGPGAEGVGRMKALFGTQQALQAAMTLSGKNTAIFNKTLNEMNGLGSTGARTEAAFKTTMDGLNQSLSRAGSAINAAAVSLGLRLLPATRALIPIVTHLAVGAFALLGQIVSGVSAVFSRHSGALSRTAQLVRLLTLATGLYVAQMVAARAITLAVAIATAVLSTAQKVLLLIIAANKFAVGAFTLVMQLYRMGLLGTAIATDLLAARTAILSAVLGVLQGVLGFLRIAFALAWVAATGPLSLIVLGVAAVATGFFLLYTKVGRFHNAVNAVGSYIKDHLILILKGIPIVGLIADLIWAYQNVTIFHNAINNLATLLKNALGGALDFIFNKILHLGSIFKHVVDALKSLPGFMAGMAGGAVGALNAMSDALMGLAGGGGSNNGAQVARQVAARARGAGGGRSGFGGPSGTAFSGLTITPAMAPYMYGVGTTAAQRTAASALTDPAARTAAAAARATASTTLAAARSLFMADKKNKADATTMQADISRIVTLTVAQYESRGVSAKTAQMAGDALMKRLESELSTGSGGKLTGSAFMRARGLGPVLYARQSRVTPGAAADYGSTTVSFLGGARDTATQEIIRHLRDALKAAQDQVKTLGQQLDIAKKQLATDMAANGYLGEIARATTRTAGQGGGAPVPGALTLRRHGIYP